MSDFDITQLEHIEPITDAKNQDQELTALYADLERDLKNENKKQLDLDPNQLTEEDPTEAGAEVQSEGHGRLIDCSTSDSMKAYQAEQLNFDAMERSLFSHHFDQRDESTDALAYSQQRLAAENARIKQALFIEKILIAENEPLVAQEIDGLVVDNNDIFLLLEVDQVNEVVQDALLPPALPPRNEVVQDVLLPPALPPRNEVVQDAPPPLPPRNEVQVQIDRHELPNLADAIDHQAHAIAAEQAEVARVAAEQAEAARIAAEQAEAARIAAEQADAAHVAAEPEVVVVQADPHVDLQPVLPPPPPPPLPEFEPVRVAHGDGHARPFLADIRQGIQLADADLREEVAPLQEDPNNLVNGIARQIAAVAQRVNQDQDNENNNDENNDENNDQDWVDVIFPVQVDAHMIEAPIHRNMAEHNADPAPANANEPLAPVQVNPIDAQQLAAAQQELADLFRGGAQLRRQVIREEDRDEEEHEDDEDQGDQLNLGDIFNDMDPIDFGPEPVNPAAVDAEDNVIDNANNPGNAEAINVAPVVEMIPQVQEAPAFG